MVLYTVGELTELKRRMRAAEVEAGSLRRQLLAAAESATREVEELEELRKQNKALKGQQGAVQKVSGMVMSWAKMDVRGGVDEAVYCVVSGASHAGAAGTS